MQSSSLFAPHHPNHEENYPIWRDKKLKHYRQFTQNLSVTIENPDYPQAQEIYALWDRIQRSNMAIYRFSSTKFNQKKINQKKTVHQFATHFGLTHLDNNLCADKDSLTSLQVRQHTGQHEYIPYTTRRLSWHTDGYYNKPDAQIRGMLLHCVQPALKGGENLLLDHEIAYILLHDENPAYISALMQTDAMTIPANRLNGEIIRPDRSGPVFSMDNQGILHMRYSARTRNIIWKDDPLVQEAAAFLQTLWEDENSPWIIRYRLKAGEGLLCNNVLHRRTTFSDADNLEQKRLLYRGRYYDRINVKI